MKHIKRKNYKIHKSDEYQDWLDEQTLRDRHQIAGRISKIEEEGYFGIHKFLTDVVWELEWLNGRRVYYAYIAELDIILLLGGNKNGQNQDITKAKKIFRKYAEIQT
ncbi:MAG: hypothetical protein P4L31_07960 [Candidatus Babeliales bacterium]|nr:hypothetical protein [Candidatus Babeliales bacterium]